MDDGFGRRNTYNGVAMTDLQQAEFEILKEFVAVCERLGLRYYLVCGSCLGAVKYGGFIPWDDDIDVAMPRDDYRVFCEKAPGMLGDGLFLQTNKSDRYYPNIFAKLRDKRTTFIEKGMAHLDICHGVYIDVFPLDGYPADPEAQRRFEKKKTDLKHKINCVYINKLDPLHTAARAARRLLGYGRRAHIYTQQLIDLCGANPLEGSKLWCNFGNWQGKKEYAPRSQYGDGSEAVFEGLRVRVPEDYDAYLSQKYGDWRADLPEEQKYGHHYHEVCDLSKPYGEYITRVGKGRVKLRKDIGG